MKGDNIQLVIPKHMETRLLVYNKVPEKNKIIVNSIHERIGFYLPISRNVKYIIVYAGGIGTIHLSIFYNGTLVYGYKKYARVFTLYS